MFYYLTQIAYTPEAYRALIQNPQDRIKETVRQTIEELGGEVVDSWLTFGEYDAILISKLPDNVVATSFAMAAMAGGGLKAIKTMPLVTWEEGVEAMRRAQDTAYLPPKVEKG